MAGFVGGSCYAVVQERRVGEVVTGSWVPKVFFNVHEEQRLTHLVKFHRKTTVAK